MSFRRIAVWSIFCLVASFGFYMLATKTEASGIYLLVIFSFAISAGYAFGSFVVLRKLKKDFEAAMKSLK